MRRVLAAATAVVVVLVGVPVLLLFLAAGSSSAHLAAGPAAALSQPCQGATTLGGPTATEVDGYDFTAVQMRNFRSIVQVGLEEQVPTRGLVVALAVTMQESWGGLNLASEANPDSLNYPHDDVATGDYDSVGLFQQRDSWGPMSVRMDPVESPRMFYTGGRNGQRGLLDIDGWEAMPIWQAAQRVQVSAYPRAYEKWEDDAAAAVAAITGNGTAVIEQVCEPAAAPVVAAGGWVAPLGKGTYTLTSPYGYRTHPVLGYRRLHTGQDLGAPRDTPIYAASAGTVSKADDGNGYGNLVIVDHGDDVQTYYAHQCPGCIDVTVGQTVTAGQQVGGVGTTGLSTGNHLHFEVRLDGEPIDPKPYLNERGVSW